MISICIPVYNFNVTSLINSLTEQIIQHALPCEIIAIDDHSTETFRSINRESCAAHQYIELPANIGRAKIRNLFLNYAQYDYLLFLDCDSTIVSEAFFSNYVQALSSAPEVVCGGRTYEQTRPDRSHMLRWKYGNERESKPYLTRRKNPNASFMTNNFIIKKLVLEKIKFDERFTTYGHEDTLFGFALKKANIEIVHIDNPVLNGEVESNDEFLRKTNEGVVNLKKIVRDLPLDTTLTEDVTLLKFYKKVEPFKFILNPAFKLLMPVIEKMLKQGYVNLRLFDLYKLGLFMRESRKEKNPPSH